MTHSVAVVTAGLSEPSSTSLLGDRLTSAVREAFGGDVSIVTIPLRPLAHEITNALLNGFAAAELQSAYDAVAAADTLIAVTPTFNASYSGLFKSFFDALPADVLVDKPVLIAATGGTERHSLVLEHALRPMFSYLGALVVPTGVYAASSDWGSGAALGERIARAARQLAKLVVAAPAGPSADPFADVVPFEELLRG